MSHPLDDEEELNETDPGQLGEMYCFAVLQLSGGSETSAGLGIASSMGLGACRRHVELLDPAGIERNS